MHELKVLCLRENFGGKNLLLFGKSSNGLDPPTPLYFWNPSRNFLKNHILDKLNNNKKFLEKFGFGHDPPPPKQKEIFSR